MTRARDPVALFPVLLLFCVALGTGCAVHRPQLDRPPLVEAAPRFAEARAAPAAPGSPGPRPRASWWESFADAGLDELVLEALAANLDLEQLVARLEQAEARVREAGGQLWPMLDAAADYAADWDDRGEHGEDASAGGLLSWEVDLWGRLRSAKRAAAADADAAREDWLDGRLLLSVAVAETYFEIAAQRAQLALLNQQIASNNTLLDLTRVRFGQGLASIVDVLQQREQLAATRALVPAVEARVRELEYSLDVLLGRAPGAREDAPVGVLATPPPLPAVGVPADLLERRPDLRAARRRLDAVDHRVGEAIADRLPRLVLGGSLLGAGNPGLDTLVAGLFASALGPVVDGGIRRAVVGRRRAELREALARYSQTYLTAVQEVESALVRERRQAETVELLEAELDTAQTLLRETRNRYSQGLTDYLPVLAAVVRVQDLERDLIASRLAYVSSRIALHRALGGPVLPSDAAADGNPS